MKKALMKNIRKKKKINNLKIAKEGERSTGIPKISQRLQNYRVSTVRITVRKISSFQGYVIMIFK